MTPTTATPFLPRWILLSLAVLLLVFAAVFLPGVLSADWNPFSAQSEDGSEVPAKPTGLSVATEQGSLNVSADWDDVEGADDYLVRWRPNGERLNEGVRTQSSSAAITLDDYGEWVVRVQACNDAGCGKPTSERFSVEPAPEPTPTPTPITPNQPPVFDRNNIRIHTVLENYGPLIYAGVYVLRDPENDRITTSLAGADAASFSAYDIRSGNEVRVGLDLNATPDYESPADANGDGVYEVTIQATDAGGSGETTKLDVTVTVLDVDEAPVITGPATVSFAEHSGSGVGQYSAADPEGGTATQTLGGTDAASFTFADGTLTFNAAPDYETKDSYSVTLTASDGTNTSTLGVTITITDVDETTVNFGPVVDDQAERYQGFTGTDNAPRGTLVSKVYDGIFSDPNGDTLTYTVSIPADRSGLVDTVYVLKSAQRVFIRLDADDDWGAVTPALPKPLVTTVTLTATDPGGLSASVTGEFRTNWEAAPASALSSVCDRTPQVRDVLVKLLGKACENITAEDLSRVTRLGLSNTGLRSLRTEDFSGMSSLREVDVSSNSFTAWTDVCGTGKWGDSVTDINLNNNKDIGGTGAALPGNCFVGAPNLKTLHLAGTRINSLPANAFGATGSRLTDLWWLDLSRNQIATLDVNVFDGLSNLWYLDLGRNELTSTGLPASATASVFEDLSSLEWLALNNQFEQDEDNEFEPKTTALLTSLNANVFTGLTNLKELDLANNGFTKTSPNILPDGVFTPLTSLEGLALFGNDGAPWTVAQLIAKGVRNNGTNLQAVVLQDEAPPGNFEVEPGDGKITLSWTKPSGTGTTHQYRYQTRDPDAANPRWSDFSAWTDTGTPTDDGTGTLEVDVTGLTAGHNYFFQIRSVKSGAHSFHANANYDSVSYGTSGVDRLVGVFGPDYIVGLAGNDHLIGGGGSTEKLEGGDGDDVLDGSQSSNAALSGGAGDDTLFSGYGANLDGGAGTDIVSYARADVGVTLDLADATNNEDIARSNTFTSIERYDGSVYDDSFTGDGNANVFEGGAGDDTLDGAAGSDTVSYTGSSAAVTVSLNDNTTSGGDAEGDTISNFENITGSDYDDTLTGDANANVLGGEGGDDTLEGLAGGDTLNCGDGVDTLSYASSNAGVTVKLFENTASGGHAASDTISNCENLTGSAVADTLAGDANVNVLKGAAGADALTGRGGDDVIEGGAGGDTKNGGAGTDTVSYAGSSAAVTVTINGTVSGGDAAGDTLSNFENILGSTHADTLTGDANANVIEGGAGGDTLDCAGGSDTLSYAGSSAGVTVNISDSTASGGDAQGDTISNCENITGSEYHDFLTGDANNNVITDLGGASTQWGGAGDDRLIGGSGEDKLWGQDGDDTLMGGPGTDQLGGGPGADILNGGTLDQKRWEGDWVDYTESDAGVTVNLTTGKGTGGHAEGDTYISIEGAWGSVHDDTLIGNADNNWFIGFGADDSFDGGAGYDMVFYYWPWIDSGITFDLTTPSNNTGQAVGDTFTSIEEFLMTLGPDIVIGDAEDNIFQGYYGDDNIKGMDGNDTIRGNNGADTLIGNRGDDTLYGNAHNDDMYGGFGDDVLYGGSGNDAVQGQEGNDTLYGGSGADTLEGGDGDDTLEGGSGSDTLWGEGGTGDTLSYASSGAGVTVNIADRTASGGHAQGDTGLGGFENLIGSAHADTLTGDANANVIEGGAGDDTLEGLAGADTLRGQAGNDTASYASSGAAVTVHIGNNTASGGHAAGDRLFDILNLIGSAHADTLTGDANANEIYGGNGDDILEGLAGADTLRGQVGNNTVTYASSGAGVTVHIGNNSASGGHAAGDTFFGIQNLIGSAHDDTLTGDANANEIYGGNGDDTLEGLAGADTLRGQAGNDTASYASSNAGVAVNIATTNGSGGHASGDSLFGIQNLIGSAHADTLTGDANANRITGGAGADTINGGAGADTLDGSAGTDTVSYVGSDAAVNVSINGNASGGHAAGDTISNFENITGSAHNDIFTGDGNANVLWGREGNDTMSGGGGNDRLRGGAGNDLLAGAAGTDEFIFFGSFGNDTISAYASGEKIWICIGSGKGNGNGQVNWTSAADGVNWKITVTSKDNSGNSTSDGVITLLVNSSGPGSNVAWANPTGATCSF